MNNRSCIKFAVGSLSAIVLSLSSMDAWSQEQNAAPGADSLAGVQSAVASAQNAVNQARAAIEKGKPLLQQIPADSPLMGEVRQMLQAAAENWSLAVESLDGAKKSAEKVSSVTNGSVSDDYALLAKVGSGVAISGAKVVQISIMYVEAVASEKTESLDVIRSALQNALASASQVQFNYERVKALIAEKYTK